MIGCFFFSSRRRHTRWNCDLSSDVCSSDLGRIIAITYAPGSATGSWQPWVAMGSAKAAKESLVRYFAVALAQRGITVNSISPGACDDSVLSGLPPEVFKLIKDW